MANSGADKALAGYFDDLLGGSGEGADACPPEADAAPSKDSETAKPEKATSSLRQGQKHTVHTPAAKPQPQPQPNPQPEPQPQPEAAPEPLQHIDLSMLEEQKRLKLQRLLSQQVVAPAPPKVEVKVQVEEKVEQKIAPPPVAPPVEVEVQPAVETQTSVETELDTAEVTASAQRFLTWGDNGRPLWAEGEFDVLLFDVAGLSLAVPLVALGHIVPLDKKLTHLQGQSDWFMGILPASVGDIRTVNTALFVMPERYKPNFAETAKYVVTIDGLPWGLAVDDVHQPIRLGPDDVKWRSERSKRPWLAGTVKSHMCALIDIPQMAHLLEQSDKSRP